MDSVSLDTLLLRLDTWWTLSAMGSPKPVLVVVQPHDEFWVFPMNEMDGHVGVFILEVKSCKPVLSLKH